nr:pancreatic triacylglycerol lipase-like [Parasteatoda tepidariorum]
MFHLYTRRNKNRPVFLSVKRGRSIKKTTFNPSALTRMIIHGVNDNQYINSWFQRLKDAILERADENVIIVDWSGSNRFPYTIAVANTRVVGAVIAQFINYLYKTVGASPESFHLLGHSLGSHVAGYAGERLHKLGRITGLDPAGPFYRRVPDNVRLDPSDAVLVDVIHSDPGETILEGFGTAEDAGDLDFYPAGGDPPGCDKTLARSIVEDRPTEERPANIRQVS